MRPTIPLLGTHLKERKSVCGRHICIPTLLTASFIITNIQNQPKCPPTLRADAKNVMGYYSARVEMWSFHGPVKGTYEK